MPYTVEHVKEDQLLRSYTKELEPRLIGTYIDKVTVPYYRLLLNFISTELVGEYATRAELLTAVQKWPQFVREQTGEIPHYEWDELSIVNGNLIACGESPGGAFVVAGFSFEEEANPVD